MAYDKVVDSAQLDAALTATANAIREKAGNSDACPWDASTGFASPIAAIQAGGGGGGGGAVATAPLKDVNFYDYDGTRLYSYTLEEAQALTQLPALPSQPGLICQGWNWTLEDIKAMGRAVDVGAMYITDDGKTRLYITIAAEGRMDVELNYNQNNPVTVDWGDGSAIETTTGSGHKNPEHSYENPGSYVITLRAQAENGTINLGMSSSSYCVFGSTKASNRIYCNMLQKVELGSNVGLREGAFCYCHSLKSVTIPNGVTLFDANAFSYCYSLKSVTIPNSITSVGSYAFRDNYSLKSVSLPNGITSIGSSYTFYNCYSLERITIPNGVNSFSGSAFYNCYSLLSIMVSGNITSINGSVFYNCTAMLVYDFTEHTAVPTLSSTITGIPSDCEIRVPAALYDEWIAAANWSTYASQIVAV